ncbi:hypothetical protein POJ06DRAFT_281353 [Lipomyces tetrasporus]|uniref:Uncharacterized protein n=1 Tax=Lipomyces tetrasporus TaxID=54092 RepID=A0AAD7VT08_9ASCO|nr:uncharacterized protein POJ06DRAFT_281353 [Lipomyces tetrasporus]KAJ8100224.1 hypothetical protein POJ06DRAFT_281353 [Lipomyces tetrasporus]
MDSPLAKFQQFYRQPRSSRSDQILLLTDCAQEVYQTIISEIKETYPWIEVVYSASQQALYVSTVRCEVGDELRRHVAETLGSWLNSHIGFDSDLLFSYTTMSNPFFVKSCVVPSSDLTILQYSEDREHSTTFHAGRVFFESGYLSHYKQLMTKIKLHAGNDKSNLPVTIFLTLKLIFVEELNYEAQMQQFEDTLLSYRRRYHRDIIQNIGYHGQYWFGELNILPYSSLLRCIDCLEWLKNSDRKVTLDVDLHINDALTHDGMIPHPRGSFSNSSIPLTLERDLLVEVINVGISETAMIRFERFLTAEPHTGEGEG